MTKRSAALVLSALALSGGGLVGQSRAEAVHDRVVFADIHARALHDVDRYLTDSEIRASAANGGLIGIWPAAEVKTAAGMVRQIDHVKEIAGVDHIAIASDLRGMSYFPAFGEEANFRAIIDGLIEGGYTGDEIGRITGGNFFRRWQQVSRAAADRGRADAVSIAIHTPMPAPRWAELERRLLADNVPASREFFRKYFDERGYIQAFLRWGANDGPDDAFENFNRWPELHALGADDEILRMMLAAHDGMIRQYSEAKTTDVPAGRNGMYVKEFSAQSDWMHHGEGLQLFNRLSLSAPAANGYESQQSAGASVVWSDCVDPQVSVYG